jgi:hypothetical protein
MEAEFGTLSIGILCENSWLFRTRSNLVEKSLVLRWPLILSAKLMAYVGVTGVNHRKVPTIKLKSLCSLSLNQSMEMMASKDAALPASMDLSLHTSRGEMASPSWGWCYSFVAAQPGHEQGWMWRLSIARGIGC